MDEVIETSLEIMAPQLKYEGIVFKKEITPNLSVKGNKIHLEEIFVNITSNAIHAIKHNQKKEKELILKIHKNSPKTLLMEFKDTGYGIKREMLEDIFLDFVTTKATSEGTGMGLGRVRKIVENHGGKIWAESEGGDKGASFFIELPLAT
jgi:signal transduction histidine kinase